MQFAVAPPAPSPLRLCNKMDVTAVNTGEIQPAAAEAPTQQAMSDVAPQLEASQQKTPGGSEEPPSLSENEPSTGG